MIRLIRIVAGGRKKKKKKGTLARFSPVLLRRKFRARDISYSFNLQREREGRGEFATVKLSTLSARLIADITIGHCMKPAKSKLDLHGNRIFVSSVFNQS